LTVSSTAVVERCFTDPAPNAQPYTHIIDLTGDGTWDRPAEVYISNTLNVSLCIAHEATKHSVKSYLRYLPPFYEHVEKKVYKETDMDGWKPWGTRGVCWHETMRAVGNIPDLPVVVVRGAVPYGLGHGRHEINTSILLGLVYKHLNEEMKFIWSPKLRKNTIHMLDWVGGIWATSLWAGEHDRAGLNSAAGVSLPPSGDKLVETAEGTVKKAEGGVLVPVIHLVDDSDLTQESLGAVIAKVRCLSVMTIRIIVDAAVF
jgi:hypothetical protein